jgi:hypothetical protein
MTAFITSPKAPLVPKTFQELSASSKYSWGASRVFRDGVASEVFRRSENPVMKHIYQIMSATESNKDDVECIFKAGKEKYACFAWAIMLRFYFKIVFSDRSGHHPFVNADDTTCFVQMGYIFRKREIFRGHFDTVLRQSFNTGLIKNLIKRDWNSVRMAMLERDDALLKLGKSWDSHSGPQPLTVQNFKGAFSILFPCLLFAFIMFLLEQAKVVKKVFKREIVLFVYWFDRTQYRCCRRL